MIAETIRSEIDMIHSAGLALPNEYYRTMGILNRMHKAEAAAWMREHYDEYKEEIADSWIDAGKISLVENKETVFAQPLSTTKKAKKKR